MKIINRIYGIIGYLLVLIKALGEAWIDVIKRSINGNIEPNISVISTEIDSLAGQVLLASSITLTPGTLTIELAPKRKQIRVASISPRTKEEIIPFEPYIKKIFD